MAQNFSLPLRRAVLTQLKRDAAVTALIPSANIYPSSTPPPAPTPPVAGKTYLQWPFYRQGVPLTVPFRASGLDSSTVRFAGHAFTKPLLNAQGAMLATAEDQAHKMAAVIAAALDGAVLALEGGMKATLTWLGSSVIQDGDEADAWHAVVNISADIAG